MKNIPLIDANIVLRYLLSDNDELSPQAADIIDNNIVELPIEALCEVVFVLTRVYNTPRKNIRESLEDFFDKTATILPNREAVLEGIRFFGKTKLDFVDCILAGYCSKENAEIRTFDNGLQRLLEKIKTDR
jgi:predicted nucleic-acid-binding protein